MTREDAFREATALWSVGDGTIGTVQGPYREHSRGALQCQVGIVGCYGAFIVRGIGETWEEAFADAAARERRAR